MFCRHTDPGVRSCALEMNARFKLLCESPDELAVPRPRRKIRPSVFDFERDSGDGIDEYDYALVYLTDEGDSQRVGIDRYMGSLPLSLDALTEAALQMPSRRSADAFVLQLARHPAATVRAAIASRNGLSLQAIELLKNDKTYAVRRSMLNNEEVLMELSGEDILGILAGDAGLFDEAFGFGCPSRRISRLLKERFAESEDPYVREIISRFED